jgi:hypothetical protein
MTRKAPVLLVLAVVGAAVAVTLLVQPERTPIEAAERVSAAGILERAEQPATETEAAPTPETVAAPTTAQERRAVLLAALSAIDAATTVDFAVSIVDHKTGTTFSYEGDQAFDTASVVKVEILASLLLQARQEGHDLSSDQQDLADIMITQSDNDAASTLWSEIGDADGLRLANRAFGLTSTHPGDDGYWGLTTTTASDQVRLLDAIASPSGPLGPANATVLDLMGEVVSDQDWGVSAAAQPGETTILKNGWLSLDADGGQWEVNSIGRITSKTTDVTIAVMSCGSADLDDGIALVEKIAQMTRTQLAV